MADQKSTRDNWRIKPKKDLTGQRFNRWIVVAYIPDSGGSWLCRCDCGTEKAVRGSKLISRLSQSCGCFKDERATTHGHSYTLTYASWDAMKRRCLNPRFSQYPRYGARGIKICKRWVESFENFLADMGERTSKDITLDRIDNDSDYTPENCRWASKNEQNNNKSSNKRLTHDGKTMTISEWCRHLDIPFNTLANRIKRGLSDTDALTRPIARRRC